MTLDQAKQELIKRYRYLYENACFILAPYMYEQSEEEFKRLTDENIKKYKNKLFEKPLIYLKISREDTLNSLFEELLLSDKSVEDSRLYQVIESKKNDTDYLDKVKKGLELLEKENADKECKIFETKLSIWEVLERVADYIEEQSGDLKNKERKLYVIDQYYRILRYKNNGRIYTSGRRLNMHDVNSMIIDLHERKPSRDKNDIGVRNNIFITAITSAPYHEDNLSIFTENEKQEIYLGYHDELPCDLEITCDMEEEYIPTMIETRLHRPENTKPCGKSFVIREEEIFINQADRLYRYYQLCPHCGYIVNVPKEILSKGIKQRIEDRCSKDDKLFRKMFLYSELFSLDKNATKEQKKLLKK